VTKQPFVVRERPKVGEAVDIDGDLAPLQARLLETLVSNCTFDRGSLSVAHRKSGGMFVECNRNEYWLGVRDDFRNWLIRAA
jgi:hypothetical protein